MCSILTVDEMLLLIMHKVSIDLYTEGSIRNTQSPPGSRE